MTFNLQQVKNLIFVANEFNKWQENGKSEPVEITEEIPLNLWNLFRFYLLRLCDTKTVLFLPPQETIGEKFLYGVFGNVVVSPQTKVVAENAFANANIAMLTVNSKTVFSKRAVVPGTFVFYDDKEKSGNSKSKKNGDEGEKIQDDKLANSMFQKFSIPHSKSDFYDDSNDFFRKALLKASFCTNSNANDIFEIKDECEKSVFLQNRISLIKKQIFLSSINLSEVDLMQKLKKISIFEGLKDNILIFDTGIKIIEKNNSFNCFAFVFETESGFTFACFPFKMHIFISKNESFKIPFILELWLKKMFENCEKTEAERIQQLKNLTEYQKTKTQTAQTPEELEIALRKSEMLQKLK